MNPPAIRLFVFQVVLLLGLVGCAATPVTPPDPSPTLSAAATATLNNSVASNPNNSDVAIVDVTAVVSATSVPPTATETAVPSATPTATPSPTPTPALRQLTTGECCVTPFWRADGQAVRFLDRPTADLPAGYYEVSLSVTEPALIGDLVTETLGYWTLNDRFYLIPAADGYTIVDNESGATYRTEGIGNNRPNLSPDGTRLGYQISDQNQDIPFNERFASLYTADLGGANPQLVLEGKGTSFSGWLSNDMWLLSVINPENPEERILSRYRLSDGATMELARGTRIQGTSASPDGQYIAYYVTLDRQHPERNGYWLTNTETGATRALPFVGAYRWRDADSIVVIPFEPEATSFRLQVYEVATDTLRDLTDPATVPFLIHNNDWALSPDGNRIVFVNAADRNLWLLEVP
jgi:hypothetical protein